MVSKRLGGLEQLNIRTEIEKLRASLMEEIQDAVTSGDARSIIAKSRLLEACDSLAKKCSSLEAEVSELKKAQIFYQADETAPESLEPQSSVLFQTRSEPVIRDSSRKESLEKARVQRSILVEELRKSCGIQLRSISKTVYATENGKTVGMAFATERQPNKWFLGLPHADYSCIVLICEPNVGAAKRFIFPKSFCQEHIPRLSKSKDDNQLKFNVYHKNGQFGFIIPRSDPVNINEFLERFDAFQE